MADRDSDDARSVVAALRARGSEVLLARDGESAVNALARTRVDALVCALRASRLDGFAVLAALRAGRSNACAIMISEGPELDAAVEAMRRGAFDVQARPARAERVLAMLDRGLEQLALAERAGELEDARDRSGGSHALTGSSRAIQRVREQVAHVAPTRAPVLIEGEEGSGRRVAARMLHRQGGRRDGPLVWLECGGTSERLVEAELCGTETQGAPPVPGRIELAAGGTLVVHGVEHLGARAQVILLRLLQERAYERVGGTRALRADVRIVATAGRDLQELVTAGTFRADAFRALALVRIALPPLRERREDIPLLADGLLRELAREHGRRPRRLTRGVVDRLVAHEWPGNVAELKRVLEGLVLTAGGRGPIDVSTLSAPLRGAARPGSEPRIEVGMTLEEAGRALLEATLRRAGGDKPRAAEMLGIGLRTLYRKLDRDRGR